MNTNENARTDRRPAHVTPAVLDGDGAAEYLRITKRHLRELHARREITVVRIGKLIRFRLADLDEYIERNVQLARPRP